jgi:hypothetical protein
MSCPKMVEKSWFFGGSSLAGGEQRRDGEFC